MRPDLLHIITTISNPLRWQSRIRLFQDFKERILATGANLHVVECAYGDSPHLLAPIQTPISRFHHIPVWASTQCWQKENLLNIGISRLPRDWKYLAWMDADIEYRKEGWASEIVHALQHYPVVQPWAKCLDLGPDREIIQVHKSFGRRWKEDQSLCGERAPYEHAHPGYAMAFTRTALENLGGLLEVSLIGSGDHHMAMAMIGKARQSVHQGVHSNFLNAVLVWEKRARQHIQGRLGYLPFDIEHHWHGPKDKRAYQSRWDIAVRHQYDPLVDVKKNTAGVIELAGNKPKMAYDIQAYFASRDEDTNSL